MVCKSNNGVTFPVVASYGTINDPGFSSTSAVVINAPYSAYVIGDYTGITPP